jgi:hypothetical protein
LSQLLGLGDRGRYLARAKQFVMLKIETIADLDILRERQCAVVFIWVDWAIHARQSAGNAERMIAEWNGKHPNLITDLLRIDLSEQSGEMWNAVEEWLGSQSISDAGSLIHGGAGSIMWVRSGTIVRYVVNANTETVDGLVALMSQSFSGQETGTAK